MNPNQMGSLHFGLVIVLSFQYPRGAPGPSASIIRLIPAALSAFTALRAHSGARAVQDSSVIAGLEQLSSPAPLSS